ncbi:MAG TPA: peptide ABC transporter substrate-binding protein [Thermoanaerobaculia bacterium]|jgi:peptide/nickel transport system substrate-binding protein|nr:peptide ABC transporter substrate-binding protein [Thermoanaerobaculia bacterium]
MIRGRRPCGARGPSAVRAARRCCLAVTAAAALAAAASRAATAHAAAPPLRVAIPQEVANVTPYSAGVPETILDLVYDKLAAPSPYAGNATPWLARSIEPEGGDGRSWRIALRDGIRWHDGVPFSADDVVSTLRGYRDKPSNRWSHHVGDTPRLVSIEKLDRLSLRVTCELPCPLFDKVTAADLPILPAHLWRDVKEPHLYRGPLVGTGPFRVAEMAPGRFLRLIANRDYFAGTPRVDAIVVTFIRNPTTALAALRAGEVDLVAAPVAPELVAALARQPDLAVQQGAAQPLDAIEMRLNFDRMPLSDPAFRQAVALAVRPDELVRRVALGQALPGSIGFPPPSPWTAPGLTQPNGDPAAAARLLDERGFHDRDGDGFRDNADGSPLRLGIKVSSSEALQLRAAQVVARQLAAVGIRAHVEVVDPARLRALYTARQFDLMLGEVTAHTLVDPDQLVVSFMTGYLWRHGLPNARLDGLLGDWRAAATPEARVAAGFALQRLHEEAPAVLMLYYPQSRFAYRPRAFDHWRGMPGMGVFHKWSLVDFSRVPAPWSEP